MTRSISGTDMNTRIAALLRDFAEVQPSTQRKWGYKRAAAAILALEEPVESLVEPDGTLRKIANIGPSSTRIILEVLKTGTSATIEQAIAESGRAADVERRRGLREHVLSRSQVLAALRNKKLKGPRVEDYRGDLQMHSTWSDGSQSLADIVKAGIGLGYQFCAVTDHSYGLKIAGGVSMAELVEQHKEIDHLNRTRGGAFRLLKGIEANIRADGTIDMEPNELALLEIVVAARDDVAIEIDGDPSRQDLDYEIAKRAIGAGCLFALDSDAHATKELAPFAATALAHARLAGVPPDRVVNCWTLDKLLEWSRSRRSG